MPRGQLALDRPVPALQVVPVKPGDLYWRLRYWASELPWQPFVPAVILIGICGLIYLVGR